MSNSWFKFKEFTVLQDATAMKVCTDACLFGAWIANTIALEDYKMEKVLDIGAGTGLLSLMLAQRLSANIDAVEIDDAASLQASENFERSKYKERLRVIPGDIKDVELKVVYDLIISNPPFFENDLKSGKQNRNLALHSTALNLDELVVATKKVIKTNGFFAVLLPYIRAEDFVIMAEKHQLFLQFETLVKQTERHPYFRSMLLFSTFKSEIRRSEIIIKKNSKYSHEFTALLKDYYLYL